MFCISQKPVLFGFHIVYCTAEYQDSRAPASSSSMFTPASPHITSSISASTSLSSPAFAVSSSASSGIDLCTECYRRFDRGSLAVPALNSARRASKAQRHSATSLVFVEFQPATDGECGGADQCVDAAGGGSSGSGGSGTPDCHASVGTAVARTSGGRRKSASQSKSNMSFDGDGDMVGHGADSSDDSDRDGDRNESELDFEHYERASQRRRVGDDNVRGLHDDDHFESAIHQDRNDDAYRDVTDVDESSVPASISASLSTSPSPSASSLSAASPASPPPVPKRSVRADQTRLLPPYVSDGRVRCDGCQRVRNSENVDQCTAFCSSLLFRRRLLTIFCLVSSAFSGNRFGCPHIRIGAQVIFSIDRSPVCSHHWFGCGCHWFGTGAGACRSVRRVFARLHATRTRTETAARMGGREGATLTLFDPSFCHQLSRFVYLVTLIDVRVNMCTFLTLSKPCAIVLAVCLSGRSKRVSRLCRV
jgi:hypothetical protein